MTSRLIFANPDMDVCRQIKLDDTSLQNIANAISTIVSEDMADTIFRGGCGCDTAPVMVVVSDDNNEATIIDINVWLDAMYLDRGAPYRKYLIASSGILRSPHGEADLGWAAGWVPRDWISKAEHQIKDEINRVCEDH